jgi:hypothetical protein
MGSYLDSIEAALLAIANIEKSAFVPMPGGQDPMAGQVAIDPTTGQPAGAGGMAPPMDPSMQGGMPPEAAMMAAQGGMDPNTGQPMDPAMAQGGAPQDPMAGIPPELIQLIQQIVMETVQGMGIQPGGGAEAKPAKPPSDKERLDNIEQILAEAGAMPAPVKQAKALGRVVDADPSQMTLTDRMRKTFNR